MKNLLVAVISLLLFYQSAAADDISYTKRFCHPTNENLAIAVVIMIDRSVVRHERKEVIFNDDDNR